MTGKWDLIIVGAGLAGGLLAYRLRETSPHLAVLVLEKDTDAGGHHTWSFHHGDVPQSSWIWLKPFLAHSWPVHSVHFPEYERLLEARYYSIRSERFARIVRAALGDNLRCGVDVAKIDPTSVTLADGTRLEAPAVLDARGFIPIEEKAVAYQKFVGWDVTLKEPHDLKGPVLMDATCPQTDGYRFFYVLPWDERRVLIEDTHYSDTYRLDPEEYQREIERYASSRGWEIASWDREELGALPIPLVSRIAKGGELEAERMLRTGVPTIGVAAGLFHPTTGYSFPDVVALTEALAEHSRWESEALVDWLAEYSQRRTTERWFFRLLNRMLFRGGPPQERYRMLQHFYRLPEPIIERFYASKLSPLDSLRVVLGKPPVKISRALPCFWEGSVGVG